MTTYELLILILMGLLTIIDLVVLIVCIYELRKARREDQMERNERREEEKRLMERNQKFTISLENPLPIQGVQAVSPISTPASQEKEEAVPEEAAEEEEEKDDPSLKNVKVPIRREPILDLYARLDRNQQRIFDLVDQKFDSLGASRVLRSTYHYIVMQGMDRVGKMTIQRGCVVLECYMIEPELKDYSRENDKKIKPRGIRFVIREEGDLEPAFVALELANKKALEYRNGE